MPGQPETEERGHCQANRGPVSVPDTHKRLPSRVGRKLGMRRSVVAARVGVTFLRRRVVHVFLGDAGTIRRRLIQRAAGRSLVELSKARRGIGGKAPENGPLHRELCLPC